jgi:hypothetical protein
VAQYPGHAAGAAARAAALAAVVAVHAACAGTAPPGPIDVRLVPPSGTAPARVEAVHLPEAVVRHLAARVPTREQWTEILSVRVADDQPAMLGTYELSGRTLRFTPMFPLDPGRSYRARFDARALGDGAASGTDPIIVNLGLPPAVVGSTTVVERIFPSGTVLPENQLRLYILFSAPMGRRGGLDHVKLFDDQGREVVDSFLPLEAELWNDARTRYTLFFDPGRQKRGILPNVQMGRSLVPGRRYRIVVSREWRDANGMPLEADFSHDFVVGPADDHPIDIRAWRVASPRAATREPLVVIFPEPLDHGLLRRALGVTCEGRFLDGTVLIEAGETRWSFTPREPWASGAHDLVALGILEDLAGNRVGRAFEVDRFDHADAAEEPERVRIPFDTAAGASTSQPPSSH